MPIYIRFDGVEGRVTAAGAPAGGPHVKVFSGSTGGSMLPANVVEVSRISLSPVGGGVEGDDPAVRSKVEQLISSVQRQGPTGKLYLATEAGVWRSAGANKIRVPNNLKQLALAAHNTAVDIYVTSPNGLVEGRFRLERASVSRHPGGVNVALCDGSVKF